MNARSFVAQVARLLIWEEFVKDRLAEDGVKPTPDAIHAYQSDLDYLEGQDTTLEELIRKARAIEKGAEPAEFTYERWRHGGWYTNVRYPTGACGCVSNNYEDGKWRIACDSRRFEDQPAFKTRHEAALAEWRMVEEMNSRIKEHGVALYRALYDMERAFGKNATTPFEKAICADMDKALATVKSAMATVAGS